MVFDFVLRPASFVLAKSYAMNKTTILIVDDHLLLRQSWSFVLNNHLGYAVAGECSNALDAIEIAAALQPVIILLDINLPGMSGIEAVPLILKSSPTSKIVGVSMHSQPVYASKMIKAGAMGYLCKNSSSSEMFKALEEICKGKKYVCNEIKEIVANQVIIDEGKKNLDALSKREFEIIHYLKKGYSSKNIAEKLFIAVKTVEAHRYNMLRKLNLKNTAALVNFINVNCIDDVA